MPTIVQPTAVRAIQEATHDPSMQRVAVCLLLIGMLCFAIVAGIYTLNASVLFGLLLGVGVFLLGTLGWYWCYKLFDLVRYLWAWLRHGIDQQTAWESYFPQRDRYSSDSEPIPPVFLLIFFGPATLVVFLSALVFWTNSTTIYVIGQQTTLHKTHIAIPFVQSIRHVDLTHAVTVDATGKTVGGVIVQGTVATSFATIKDEALLVKLAAESPNPDKVITEQAQSELQAQFWNEISKRKLSELQPTLSFEYQVGSTLDRDRLAAEGVHPEGKMEISNLHPYFTH